VLDAELLSASLAGVVRAVRAPFAAGAEGEHHEVGDELIKVCRDQLKESSPFFGIDDHSAGPDEDAEQTLNNPDSEEPQVRPVCEVTQAEVEPASGPEINDRPCRVIREVVNYDLKKRNTRANKEHLKSPLLRDRAECQPEHYCEENIMAEGVMNPAHQVKVAGRAVE
jgi:hypothetical protein